MGAGFHPELTRRDAKRIYLNGATLRVEMKRLIQPKCGIMKMIPASNG